MVLSLISLTNAVTSTSCPGGQSKIAARPSGGADKFGDLRSTPVLDQKVDYRWSTVPHLDDFFENVKSRGQCKAPVQECFKATVALAMAIQSYKTKRTACWDADQERIVM